VILTHANSAFQAGQSPASSSPRKLALAFVSQSWEQLEQTPQNVVIVVISLQQQHLRMTTILRAKSESKQLLIPSSLANDDAVSLDAMVAIKPFAAPVSWARHSSPTFAPPTSRAPPAQRFPFFSGTPVRSRDHRRSSRDREERRRSPVSSRVWSYLHFH
jgi:hypothetical protein